MYCCEATAVIEDPHLMITNVSGNHLPDLGLADVENLRISNQKDIKFLPINIAEYFPNLKQIVVKHTKLEYITENDFRGLTQLSVMYMTNNKLKELPCGVFNTNKKLEEIHFEDNFLKKIGGDVFKPLPLLKVAHFRNNDCIHKDANTTSEMTELMERIAQKCSTTCELPDAYDPSSCSSKYYKTMIKQLGLLFMISIMNRL